MAADPDELAPWPDLLTFGGSSGSSRPRSRGRGQVLRPLAVAALCSWALASWVPAFAMQRSSRIEAQCATRCRAGLKDQVPTEPGRSSDQDGYEQLCCRWNREEAEAVEKAKKTLQSGKTTKEAKQLAINELEYWAIRRGGYDAEIILIGTLASPDKDLAGQAHVSLKKTWASHFNAWVNNDIIHGKTIQNRGGAREALKIFDKVIFENPIWGEGYHLRAKCWNTLKDLDMTIHDLRKALEYCPNNYLVMIELGITLMDKKQEYDEAYALFKNAAELCPFLPIDIFVKSLHAKAPHLKAQAEAEAAAYIFTLDAPPLKLLPESWIHREMAIERPNQCFLRVGAELEQLRARWFTQVREHDADRGTQRKLWGKLVIKWDPDKFPKELHSFTSQVHEALKARSERELAKVEEKDPDKEEFDRTSDEYDEEAVAFLRQLRAERRQKQKQKA
ncbi:unnamed protein product [Polarella glacialis]|uniref:Uncharacterized protein n=1 Tax=Polarella glacialis TaxID=89957 RepID=A0A813EVY9_POLGL|nr:unnamed protein product [Polarella glacialis]